MAEIKFLPVCSNCKRIIYETVDYGYPEFSDIDYIDDSKYIRISPKRAISPNCCPYCDIHFDMIMMATELPFENDKYDKALMTRKNEDTK